MMTDDIINAIKNGNLDKVKEAPLSVLSDAYTLCHYNVLIINLALPNTEVFEYIIHNTKGYFKDNYLDTILHNIFDDLRYYKIYPSEQTVAYALGYMKNINQKNYNYETVLHITSKIVSDINTKESFIILKNMIKLLVMKGANPHIKDNAGRSAIDIVLQHKYKHILHITEYLEILLNVVPKCIQEYVNINTLIYYIQREDVINKYDVIELLLNHVSDINELHNGKSLLWHAQNQREDYIVELLIENGARL